MNFDCDTPDIIHITMREPPTGPVPPWVRVHHPRAKRVAAKALELWKSGADLPV